MSIFGVNGPIATFFIAICLKSTANGQQINNNNNNNKTCCWCYNGTLQHKKKQHNKEVWKSHPFIMNLYRHIVRRSNIGRTAVCRPHHLPLCMTGLPTGARTCSTSGTSSATGKEAKAPITSKRAAKKAAFGSQKGVDITKRAENYSAW